LQNNNKPELLAPAGDFEKLKFAFYYGADAVYLGLKNLNLRTQAKNFDDLSLALDYAHKLKKKVYLALNIFARNQDIDFIKKNLSLIREADALIIADPGLIYLIRQKLPDIKIHVSTQLNIINYYSAKYWHDQGVTRIILARELCLQEIKKIHDENINLELEAFVHGSMCIAYSGRCLLSNYLTGRDSNHGDCAQACRWKYKFYIQEQTRPKFFFELKQKQNQSYILNSKDLCMIEFLPELLNAGIKNFKIEGRAKSLYYVSVCTKIYREAIDDYYLDPEIYYSKKKYYLSELDKISHREYSTGFYFSKINNQNYKSSTYIKKYIFLGIVLSFDRETNIAIIQQRNKINSGDEIEIMSRNKIFYFKIKKIYDHEDKLINSAPHAQQIIKIKIPYEINTFDILRAKLN